MSYGYGKILESIVLYTKSKLLSHKYSVILFIFKKKTNQYSKFFMNVHIKALKLMWKDMHTFTVVGTHEER